MVKQNQNKQIRAIRFNDKEWEDLKKVADESGETRSGYIRRQIKQIIKEEQEQN